jgi:hypothetical protein
MTTVKDIQGLFGRYELQVQKVIDRKNEFFNDYRKLSESLTLQKTKYYKDRFSRLLAKYKINNQHVRERLQKTAPDYNIFQALKIERKEVITHSRFLVDLLNPKGNHFQNELFLKEFIKTFLYKHPNYESFMSFDNSQIKIVNEKTIPNRIDGIYGGIDIFILSRQPKNKFVIIIENKIDASDQKKQLERYWDYARKILKLKEEQIALVYLSKRGKIPSDCSIDKELRKRLNEQNKLIYLSYKPEIYELLGSLSGKIKAYNVKHIIKQYLTIIKDL